MGTLNHKYWQNPQDTKFHWQRKEPTTQRCTLTLQKRKCRKAQTKDSDGATNTRPVKFSIEHRHVKDQFRQVHGIPVQVLDPEVARMLDSGDIHLDKGVITFRQHSTGI